jgi:hypothetical protein
LLRSATAHPRSHAVSAPTELWTFSFLDI